MAISAERSVEETVETYYSLPVPIFAFRDQFKVIVDYLVVEPAAITVQTEQPRKLNGVDISLDWIVDSTPKVMLDPSPNTVESLQLFGI